MSRPTNPCDDPVAQWFINYDGDLPCDDVNSKRGGGRNGVDYWAMGGTDGIPDPDKAQDARARKRKERGWS